MLPRRLGIVAISSNYVVEYPDDAPERLREMAAELGIGFPICYDETQEVAKAYDAACTPDFFLFDGRGISCIAASWMARGQRTTFR